MRRFGSFGLVMVVVGSLAGCASRSDTPDEGTVRSEAAPVVVPLVGSGDPAQVVARVVGGDVTLGQLDALAQSEIARARTAYDKALYEARKARLDALVDERVIEAEAKKRGVTAEALLQAEVDAKVAEPDEGQLQAFYNDYQDRMGGASFPDIKDRIKEFLVGESRRTRHGELVAELRKAHGVTVMLEPVRVAVDASGPVRGKADAPIKVVVFADFECPYCSQTAPTLDKLEEAYRGDVQIVYRHYPLSFHPNATPAAEAASCAGEQKRFWDVHDGIFGGRVGLDPATIRGFLAGLDGFDATAWDACMAAGRGKKAVEADLAAGERAGVDGTPAFFVNGIMLGGARPYEDFEALVKDELARLKR